MLDCLAMRPGGRESRGVSCCVSSRVSAAASSLAVDIVPRFVYGDIRAWLRRHGDDLYSAIGGDAGLLLCSDMGLAVGDDGDLASGLRVREGERYHLAFQFAEPHLLHPKLRERMRCEDVWSHFEETLDWWRQWSAGNDWSGDDAACPRLGGGDQGADLRADRCHRRRRHHFAAGEPRVASATGTTATAGSATRPSPSRRSASSASTPRRRVSATSSSAPRPAIRSRCSRSTASAASTSCPRSSSTICRATAAHGRCGSATRAYRQVQLDSHGELMELAWRSLAARPSARRGLLALPLSAGGLGVRALAGTGPRLLGGARRRPSLRPLQGHLLGGDAPRHPARRGRTASRRRSTPGGAAVTSCAR